MSTIQEKEATPERVSSSSGGSFSARRARFAADGNTAAATAVRAPRDNSPKTAEDMVADAGDLAALPQVVMKVIALTGDTTATAAQIEQVIGSDQALTARILTLANSSYYGLPRRISSLREAVVFLGYKTVRSLATTITAFNVFVGKSDTESLVRRDLWKHALNTALCGKKIASTVSAAGISDEIFTAALLHDIGKTLMQQHLPHQFLAAVDAAKERGVAFHQVEQEFLPVTHAEVGALLATRWNLPPLLVEAIGHHHTPRLAQTSPQTCAAIALASDLANAFGGTSTLTQQGPSLNEEAVTILGLKASALLRVSAACADELRAGSALPNLF